VAAGAETYLRAPIGIARAFSRRARKSLTDWLLLLATDANARELPVFQMELKTEEKGDNTPV
jgi:hypothetical protein